MQVHQEKHVPKRSKKWFISSKVFRSLEPLSWHAVRTGRVESGAEHAWVLTREVHAANRCAVSPQKPWFLFQAIGPDNGFHHTWWSSPSFWIVGNHFKGDYHTVYLCVIMCVFSLCVDVLYLPLAWITVNGRAMAPSPSGKPPPEPSSIWHNAGVGPMAQRWGTNVDIFSSSRSQVDACSTFYIYIYIHVM